MKQCSTGVMALGRGEKSTDADSQITDLPSSNQEFLPRIISMPERTRKSAQYTWPWEITIRRFATSVLPPQKWPDQTEYRSPRTHGSWPRSRLAGRGARHIPSRPPYRPGSVISSSVGTAAPPRGKSYRGWKSPFSHPKYICGIFALQTNAAQAAKERC